MLNTAAAAVIAAALHTADVAVESQWISPGSARAAAAYDAARAARAAAADAGLLALLDSMDSAAPLPCPLDSCYTLLYTAESAAADAGRYVYLAITDSGLSAADAMPLDSPGFYAISPAGILSAHSAA